jgi:hypothetical protein
MKNKIVQISTVFDPRNDILSPPNIVIYGLSATGELYYYDHDENCWHKLCDNELYDKNCCIMKDQ